MGGCCDESRVGTVLVPGLPLGYLCLVLHAHLPFVRHPEHDAFDEEDWLFEALTECYLPIVDALDRLTEEGIDFRLAVSLTPTLLAMLGDELLVARYLRYLDDRIQLAEREAKQASERRELWSFDAARLQRVRAVFIDRYASNVVNAFRRHAEAGRLEILASAATHAVLPLLATVPQATTAQVVVGAREHRRHFGRAATGFWLPECAYDSGLDPCLVDQGITYSFLEQHGILHADPRPSRGLSAPLVTPGGLVCFGRDPSSSREVWSAETGYPGDPAYREFHRDAAWDLPIERIRDLLPDGRRRSLGIKHHRVTGRVALGSKQLYGREVALLRVGAHADDFVSKRVAQLREAAVGSDRPPLIVSPYDAELFGHWWFEGPEFLEAVLRRAHIDSDIELLTPREYLERHDECEVAQPPLSTWGARGYVDVWLSPENDWIYPRIEAVTRRLVAAVSRLGFATQTREATETPGSELASNRSGIDPGAGGLARRALEQAGRELLLAQASDWAFIIKMGTMVEYARRRVEEHIDRCDELLVAAEAGTIGEARLGEIEARDNLFPEIDLSVWGAM